MSEHLRSAEDVAWEALSSDDYVLTPHEVLSDLIRAYAAEAREAARAEALAGLTWEESHDWCTSRDYHLDAYGEECDRDCCLSAGHDDRDHECVNGRHWPVTPDDPCGAQYRRLVGPWEPTP